MSIENDLLGTPERRETGGNGWSALAAAVCERAVDDLQATHRALRTDAAAFIMGPGFDAYLDMAGVQITPAGVRAALRRRGFPV